MCCWNAISQSCIFFILLLCTNCFYTFFFHHVISLFNELKLIHSNFYIIILLFIQECEQMYVTIRFLFLLLRALLVGWNPFVLLLWKGEKKLSSCNDDLLKATAVSVVGNRSLKIKLTPLFWSGYCHIFLSILKSILWFLFWYLKNALN